MRGIPPTVPRTVTLDWMEILHCSYYQLYVCNEGQFIFYERIQVNRAGLPVDVGPITLSDVLEQNVFIIN